MDSGVRRNEGNGVTGIGWRNRDFRFLGCARNDMGKGGNDGGKWAGKRGGGRYGVGWRNRGFRFLGCARNDMGRGVHPSTGSGVNGALRQVSIHGGGAEGDVFAVVGALELDAAGVCVGFVTRLLHGVGERGDC